ncbi:MAG: methionine aminopeptidase [Anaerolineaceae bacterium]|jgi:methionyl aminopeptidase|nr:type I methionyl aminopeptidase [Anaerolineae bacterium]MBL1172610.1 type I methionyl aminopeptidase [Chloroflexota bacterium]MBV6466502.1 Methionine aminopeptidase 1 [Anaerolineales bacterium]MDL1926371.1 type I methionyl aminopeptidase [Anaerolineae bacterium AMX1]OQY86443.1 MAG: type I methionyl aminopeptidase [Anaerolineae bacterium UTCFX3]GER81011.1 type I methionyl aminopeptidase [Candidatus Denitrolinea symbiosum]GJQ38117.1 MAG: methionine aminopeptidase [Anaerolineaceae bacterium]
MDQLRQVHIKSPAEIAIMREAGRINAEILATVKALLQPGVSTADLNAAAEEVLRKHNCVSPFKGYGHPPFPASITTSVNRELVHGIPKKDRKLREGDIVSIDSGTILDGYVGDSAITAGVGEISPKARELLEVTEGALWAGIEKMRVGNRTGDVSAAIQQYVESRGYHVTREYTGHGVGRQMHENPQVPNYGKAGTGLPLRPGMTIAIEPMVLAGTHVTRVLPDQWTVVSADGSLTAHFEHSVAVTTGEPLILTVP